MPKKPIARPDSFSDYDAEEDSSAPSARPYMPMDEANGVYDKGVTGLPTERYVNPKVLLEQERERNQQLEQMVSQLRQQGASGLTAQPDGSLVVQGFRLTTTGLISPEEVSAEAWMDLGRLLAKLEGSLQWLIGDWIVYGESIQWGDIPALAKDLGFADQTLHDYAYVARKVQFSIRIENLSFAHHRLVTTLSPEFQSYALTYAAHHQYSVADFRKWIKLGMPETGLAELAVTPLLNTKSVSSLRMLYTELEKLDQLDPGKAKPQHHQRARQIALEARRALEDFERKWGLE